MKHSIRHQMAAIFICVMAGTLLCCWLANTFFLQKYYLANKKNEIISAYETLNKGVSQGLLNDEEFTTELELICTTGNISVFVMDSSGEPKLWTNRDYEMLQRNLYSFIFEVEKPDPEAILEQSEDYIVRQTREWITQADYIEIVGRLDSGDSFIMRTAMESIRESAAISNRFFTYIGIGAILISSILIWWQSRRISKPMLELADISRRMTELDFDAKFTSNQENEIGLLGQNMNQLSESLERTISELKTANNELQKDIEKKTQMDEMRKEFLSNVSHELKTPIALIQGYAEGLKECINEDPESREFYCDVIIDEAAKMNSMVKKLLSLNQLESGNDVVTIERFDLIALIRNVLSAAHILMEQQNIRLIFKETEAIYVWADEFMIEEVLTNYISNAIHHCGYDKIIELKVHKQEKQIRVSVFNTGNPIPEEELGKIWIKFYKVDKARTREYGGNGIGLSIVKAVMNAHHKECGVQNYENGVEFWFELEGE